MMYVITILHQQSQISKAALGLETYFPLLDIGMMTLSQESSTQIIF